MTGSYRHEPVFIHGIGDGTQGFLHAGQTPYQLSSLALRHSVRAGSCTHHKFSGVWHREQACAVNAQGKQSWLCSWKVSSFCQKSDSYTPRTDRDRTSWGGSGLQVLVKHSGLCKAVISPTPHKRCRALFVDEVKRPVNSFPAIILIPVISGESKEHSSQRLSC